MKEILSNFDCFINKHLISHTLKLEFIDSFLKTKHYVTVFCYLVVLLLCYRIILWKIRWTSYVPSCWNCIEFMINLKWITKSLHFFFFLCVCGHIGPPSGEDAVGKSFNNIPCLQVIIAYLFTCGERKFGKTSKSLKIFRKWL